MLRKNPRPYRGKRLSGRAFCCDWALRARPYGADRRKPKALHSEIQQVIGKKRVPRTVSLFVQWLLTKNTGTVQVKRETLYERLRLTNMVKHRRQERLEKTLHQCYEVAKELGYLLDYKEEFGGLMTFTLNPERCKRIGKLEEAVAFRQSQSA